MPPLAARKVDAPYRIWTQERVCVSAGLEMMWLVGYQFELVGHSG